MTIAEVKKEIYYYTGLIASDKAAREILDFYEQNGSASLCEIINDYFYEC